MRLRVLFLTTATSVTLVGASSAALHAQGAMAGGVLKGSNGARPMGGGSPGVGPFAVFVTDRNQKISLGRATGFTLQESSGVDAATGAASGRRAGAGTALIEFASNDEQVAAQSCVMTPGCSLQEVVIQALGSRGEVMHEWALRPVIVSELHMGSATTVSFSYQSVEHMAPGNVSGSLNPTKAP